MLKNTITRRSCVLLQKKFASVIATNSRVIPSTTQSLLLKNIPITATEATVKDSLKSIAFRKLELEPGCSLHFVSESEASHAASILRNSLNYETRMLSTTMPSLLLKILGQTTGPLALQDNFSSFNPRSINISGQLKVEVVVKDSSSAVKLSASVNSITVAENGRLQANTVKLPNQQYLVNVVAPVNTAESTVLEFVQKAISSDSSIKSVKINSVPAAKTSFQLRFPGDVAGDLEKLEVHFKNTSITLAGTNPELRKPVVVIRNAKHLQLSQVEGLFNQHRPERIQPVLNSRGKMDSVVAYFSSERAALTCLQSIKGARFNNHALSAVYREVEEPAVLITGLPDGATEDDVKTFCKSFTVGKVVLDPENSSATVFVSSPKEAELASVSLTGRVFNDVARHAVKVHQAGSTDLGVTLTTADRAVTEESISAALFGLGLVPKSISQDSNINAIVGFLTTKEAVDAQNELLQGKISLGDESSSANGGGVVTSTLTVSPSFVVQVHGLDANAPASKVVDALSAAEPNVRVLKVDRSALLKMLRSKDVQPGMKSLKAIEIEGQRLSVKKYRPLNQPGNSEYDLDADHAHNVVDQFSLKMLLKDYMFSDPATRYQIAKNYFERALYDATKLNEISAILESGATPAQADEVARLVKTIGDDTNEELSSVAGRRLFQLFLQREDMEKFSGDFREIEAFLGPANEADPFDWSQFQVEHEETLERLRANVKLAEAAATEQLLNRLRGREASAAGGDDEDEEEDEKGDDRQAEEEVEEKAAAAGDEEGAELDEEDEEDNPNELKIPSEMGEEDTTISLEDPEVLRDREGHTWSGVILDTDMVQKTTPGQRVQTHRCLVMMGNLRGAGGFGMGKGRTPADALNAAFRAALRNVQHIDLYENYGLAHDLHGYHNSCHAYIRATPKTRNMIASTFAEAILTRFGISSASCKLVGRRDPYAMVNAIFKALGQHENIDEFAKDRGKRYITLKYAYENGV